MIGNIFDVRVYNQLSQSQYLIYTRVLYFNLIVLKIIKIKKKNNNAWNIITIICERVRFISYA